MKERLVQLAQKCRELIDRLENSALFEKIAISYESQDKNVQQIIKYTGIAALSLVALFILGYPVYSLYKNKTSISETRELIAMAKELNHLDRIEYLPAPPPRGHKHLSTASAEELMTSFKTYLGNHIGVAKVSYNLRASGKDIFLNISELTIRQAYRLLFQIDGWHSDVIFKNVDLKVHPKEKDLLQMSAQVSLEKGPPAPHNLDTPPPQTTPTPKPPPPSTSRTNRNTFNRAKKVAVDRNHQQSNPSAPPNIPPPPDFPPDTFEDEIPPELLEEMEVEY